MRIAVVGSILLSGFVTVTCGCSRQSQTSSSNSTSTVIVSVDMPRSQTVQFLRQSAATLKLQNVNVDNESKVIAETSSAIVSGPEDGPVRTEFSGNADTVDKWSKMILDKLPSKRLKD